mgnify:CR=1 FL=1
MLKNEVCLTNDEKQKLNLMAREVRLDILKMVYNAKSGHIGGAFSSVELMLTLFFKSLNHKKNSDINYSKRDRFILSKGHASALYYAVLAQFGYISKEDLTTFRKLGSNLQGHPSKKFLDCVEVSTGSLGQGLSIANGIALGLKLDKNDTSKVFVLHGDGELQEGNVWEAIMSSSHNKLNNIIAIVDKNDLQIDGKTDDVMSLSNLNQKFKSFNWDVYEIDGHDYDQILDAYENAKLSKEKPTCIIANTKKGYGVSFMNNNKDWHGKAPNVDEYNKAIEELK